MTDIRKRNICILTEERVLYFCLEENFLKINILKQYFPLAVGLVYQCNGRTQIVDTSDNKLQLPPDISEYRLLFETDVTKSNLHDVIKKYFNLRYTYEEICLILQTEHNTKISIRTLRRILKELNLKRKNITESSHEDIIAAIIAEIYDCGMNLGYRSMHQRLKDKYKLTVKQSTVLKLLRLIDPLGVEERCRYRLKRRRYRVPGSNYLWHIDGYDKLKKFGFAIHGCVDGYSRKVLWLNIATTNNKPEVIAYYYLKCLQEFELLPTIIRSDRGSENTLIDLLQMGLRYHHEDDLAGENSFIKGKSTANERIEKYWNQLRNHTIDYYINLFKTMQERNILDIGNIMHIQFLRFCFGPIIQHDLEMSKKEWNEHRMRKQNLVNLPSGIPNIMFYWPEKYGGRNCKQQVDQRNVTRLLDKYGQKPVLYNSNTKILINMLIQKVKIPRNTEEAYNLFIKIINLYKDVYKS